MPFPQNTDPYPMRMVDDPAKWPGLIQAYSTQPCKKILAEGDSWLAYPQLLGVKNICWHLANGYDDVLLLSLVYSGDTVGNMLTNREKLLETLFNHEFDYLLFSGGGNDVVGKWDFDFFLKPYQPGMTWQDCLDDVRLNRRIAQIKNGFLDLIEYTFTYAKSKDTIKIVTHTYDKVIPSKIGVLGMDSWLWPYLEAKNIKDPQMQFEIANEVLGRYASEIATLVSDHRAKGRFIQVETRGCVHPSEWENEIHPNSAGFKKVTAKIYAAF